MKVKRSRNRLYKIIVDEHREECLLTKVEEESWLWHVRLGHVNFKAMELLSKEGMVVGVPKLVPQDSSCEGCLMGKQTRKAFPGQTNFNSKQVLELVHGDICGPIEPTTPAGNKYFLLLVDDYSRKMWIYLLKTKGEALEAFKKFKALVENKTEQKIKTFRTDRGGEFCSNDFDVFCEESGIERHRTAPYTPQQNGVVERRNRTVVAMTRSMMKGMNLPLYFWGEAMRHSVYLLNRLPTRKLSKVTPQQAWNGTKPNLKYVRVFGCTAYAKVPAVQTRKLDDRSRAVINLGKEMGTKAYRLYDPNSGAIVVSRDVVFDERQPWDWKEQSVADKTSTFDIGDIISETEETAERYQEGEMTPVQTRDN